MTSYENEQWVELYRGAMMEFQHSLMESRIFDARTEIAARVEKLSGIPGLHAEERQAITDALNGLRMLENEQIRHQKDQQEKLAHEAMEKLRSLEPRIEQLESNFSEPGR
jgi:hypothetical protein